MAEMEEKLSAMLDGDVDEATARALFTRLKRDAAFRGEWDLYCLAGDVIRGGAQPEMNGFAAKVMARLENEPTVLAPRRKESGSGRRFFLRHRLLPVAASVMGVLAVGVVVATLSGGDASPPVQVASPPPFDKPGVVAPNVAAPAARRDYLVAHQTMAGGPMPAAVQYIRTISVSAEE
jgi:sigma-E factor negative regulatory protein RseA